MFENECFICAISAMNKSSCLGCTNQEKPLQNTIQLCPLVSFQKLHCRWWANSELLIGWCLVYPSGAKTTQDKDWFGFALNSCTVTVSAVPQHVKKFKMFQTEFPFSPQSHLLFGPSQPEASPRLAGMTDNVDVNWSKHGLGTQGSAGQGNLLTCEIRDGSTQAHVWPYNCRFISLYMPFLFSPWPCKYHQSSRWQLKHVPCGFLSFFMESLFKLPCIFGGCWNLYVLQCWGNCWKSHCNMMKPKLEQFIKQTLRALIGPGEMVPGINSTNFWPAMGQRCQALALMVASCQRHT